MRIFILKPSALRILVLVTVCFVCLIFTRFNSGSSYTFPVETFPLSYQPFVAQTLPIVIFSNYRYEYLTRSVGALQNIAKAGDIDPSTRCIFVFHQTTKSNPENVPKSEEFVQDLDFCKPEVWRYDERDHEPSALLFNKLWWKVLKRVFPPDSLYRGDVLFLEEDVVLSPDAMKVFFVCRRVKNTFGPDIHAVSLGGFAGSNHINPHPDTIIVRKTVFFQAMTYIFNRTFWEFIESHKKEIESMDEDGDFSEAIAYYFGYVNKGLHFVVPTLSRMWHIGKKGLGHWGDYSQEREIENKPPWNSSPRLMDLRTVQVNDGIRDGLGFFCAPKDRQFYRSTRDNLCSHTLCNFKKYRSSGKSCIELPYVKDKCTDPKYEQLYKCENLSMMNRIEQYFRYKFIMQW